VVEKRKKELKKFFDYEEDIVYHYCSVNSLFKIVNSKSFWLTSLNSSNDSLEIKYGKRLFHEVLSEMIESENDADTKFAYQTIFSEAKGKELINEVEKGNFYGLSFVRARDSLTHWNSYSNGGTGVAIGVNKWMFKHLLNTFNIMDILSNWISFERIIYDTQEQKKYIKRLIDNRLEMFRKTEVEHGEAKQMPNMSYYREHDFVCKSMYYVGIDLLAPKFKHTGFIDESEERLFIKSGEVESVVECMSGDFFENKELQKNVVNHLNELICLLGIKKDNVKFEVIGKTIRPYYVLDLSELWSNALIPEIIIGPKCCQNKNELRDFLRINMLKGTKVCTSKIPVR
jgi:hypothetical protein